MAFHILTIFPDIFSSYFNESILKRAQKSKLIKIKIHNIRDFAKDKHRTTDDRPFGGGPGMVMKIEPIIRAVGSIFNFKNKISNLKTKIIILSPSGKQFDQKIAREWSKKYEDIVLICGHYEGIDDRVKKILRAEEISVGPYILSGGELAAMVVVDAVSRHIPGVLGKSESLEEKKGSYPVYTRPDIFTYKNKKYSVPQVLLSGNHERISEWRNKYGKII